MGHIVQVESRPDSEEMRLHVEHLFDGDLDGCHDGLIELCWTDANTGALSRAQLFGTDEIEDLLAKACEVNSIEGQNCYIGAALRRPDAQRNQRCSDQDFFALTAAFADFDDAKAVERFKERGKFALPTIVVTTGKEPHTRFQAWWRLEEPIRDPDEARKQCSGLVAALGSDEKVVNPGRVMRLGGSIAWPKKEGRVKEITSVQSFKNAPKIYEPGRLERAYPPVDVIPHQTDAPFQNGETLYSKDGLGFDDKRIEHRESYMRDLILANLYDLVGYNKDVPTAEELHDLAWPVYLRNADQDRPGRSEQEFRKKCEYTIRRYLDGKIPGQLSVYECAQRYSAKEVDMGKPMSQSNQTVAADTKNPVSEERRKITPRVPNILNPSERFVRDWLVKYMFQRKHVTLIGGAPGAGKTTITMQMVVSLASGVDFMQMGIEKPYKCWLINDEETYEEIEGRIEAIIQHFELDARTVQKNLSIYSGVDDPKFVSAKRDQTGAVIEVEDVQDVRSEIIENKFDVVVVDPFVQAHQVNENDNAELAKVAQILRDMCIGKEHDAACCVVHHTKKPAQGQAKHTPGDMDSIRGASSLTGEAHVVHTIMGLTEDMGTQKGLAEGEYKHYARMDPAKIKGGPLGEPRWYRKHGEEMVRRSRKESALITTETEEIGVYVPVAIEDVTTFDNLKLNQILNGIQGRWDAGDPLIDANNGQGRRLDKFIMDQFDMERSAAKEIIKRLNKNACLKTEEHPKLQGIKGQKKGLRVVNWFE